METNIVAGNIVKDNVTGLTCRVTLVTPQRETFLGTAPAIAWLAHRGISVQRTLDQLTKLS